jgi:hypothetical protein
VILEAFVFLQPRKMILDKSTQCIFPKNRRAPLLLQLW